MVLRLLRLLSYDGGHSIDEAEFLPPCGLYSHGLGPSHKSHDSSETLAERLQ